MSGILQCNRSTPLHLACSQGLLEIVEQIHRSVGSGDFQNILGLVDAQGMTSLHRKSISQCR